LLAIPVLAGSGAYAISEFMKWNNGLEEKFSQARNFYIVIIISIVVGLALNFFHINPITALYWSAFINGVIALPLLAVIIMIGNNEKIMGKETNPVWVNFFGWMSVGFMVVVALLSIILFITK
ncbi:MAG: natural resistance-associated macrophage protein, partial [uncultured bacterium]